MKNMIKLFEPVVGKEEERVLKNVLHSKFWASGAGVGKVAEFENSFNKYIESDSCISVNSGTAALHLALSISNLKNCEVILPSLSFVSTAHAVIFNGGKPKFVDVNEKDLTINVELIKKAITKKTKVVLPLHFGGMPSELTEIKKICEEFELDMIEDAAYKEISEEDAKNFSEYRKNWKDSLKLQEFDFPLYMMTEQTFSCNYRCPQCILGNNEQRAKYIPSADLLSLELFKKIVDEGEEHACRSLSVHHINEPLLVPDLPERISYAHEKGFLDIHMVTNGELLDEYKARKLIKSGVTRIMISVDAHSSETFRKIRVGGNYEKVKKNIINLIKIRNSLDLKLPVIRTSFVIQKANAHEAEAFKKFWQNIVDYVHVQIYQKPYETSEDFRIQGCEIPSEGFRCDQPYNRIVIRADGTVLPCCSFYAYELSMGNVTNSTVYDIWNSKQFKELRKLHFEGRYKENSICNKCVTAF